VTGLVVLGVILVCAVLAPLIAAHSPTETNFSEALRGPGHGSVLGTDGLGRDELSRLLYGARLSLVSVTIAAFAIMLIGVTLGLASGFYGGVLDSVVQRIVEVLMAFPSLVLALAIAGMLGRNVGSVLIAVVAVGWVSYTRLVRGMVLSIRKGQYVEAARAIGATNRSIMFREILPNVLPPVLVLATLEMGALLLTLSSLSFLGLGAQPPTPEWGAMLNQARPYFQTHPYLMILPGLAITITVLAFNLVGDGLRDALDPRTRGLVGGARDRRASRSRRAPQPNPPNRSTERS